MDDTPERLGWVITAVGAIADECERRAACTDLVLGPDWFVEDGRRAAYRAAAARLRRMTRDLPAGCPTRAAEELARRLHALAEACDREAREAGLRFDDQELALSGRGRAEALRTVARGLALVDRARFRADAHRGP